MAKGPPKTVALDHDDYYAKHVGKTGDGRQFFYTNPFIPASDTSEGREYLALYLFDKEGKLLEAQIEDMGTRATIDQTAYTARVQEVLATLGKIKHGRIKMAPFSVERFGVQFGLIPQPPEEDGDDWSVIVEPGNYMCFIPPWSSGEYDT